MDQRLLLVKAITLLYRESLLTEKTDNSSDLVRTVLEAIKLPELNLSLNHDRDRMMGLKDTALYMCGNAINTTYEKEEILQRLKVNCGDDDKLYEALSQGIEKDMDEGSLKRTILSIRKFINDTFRENEIVKIIKNASSDISFNRDKIKNMRNYVSDLRTKLEPFEIESSRKDPAVVAAVDLGDDAGLTDAFQDVVSSNSDSGLLVTGWQGLNTMMQGGFRRGECAVIASLQHKYKTGFTLSLFKHFAIYNDPATLLINPNKKPCLVRISFEDDLTTNLQFLYQNLVYNETGVEPSIKDLSPGDMAKYVKEKMSVRGFHIKMLRVNPSEWTYKDIQNYILDLEANGYEVIACIVDYLSMVPPTFCEEGPSGHAMKDMLRRIRNFMSARHITFITPHQLSTEAKQLVRDGHTDFVKKLVGGGYYANSRSLDTEPDYIMFLHIEKHNKQSFLTLQRDKHRGLPALSEDKMYCVLKFPEKGSIPDDLGKAPTHLKKVGGEPVGSGGEEIPFFAFTE